MSFIFFLIIIWKKIRSFSSRHNPSPILFTSRQQFSWPPDYGAMYRLLGVRSYLVSLNFWTFSKVNISNQINCYRNYAGVLIVNCTAFQTEISPEVCLFFFPLKKCLTLLHFLEVTAFAVKDSIDYVLWTRRDISLQNGHMQIVTVSVCMPSSIFYVWTFVGTRVLVSMLLVVHFMSRIDLLSVKNDSFCCRSSVLSEQGWALFVLSSVILTSARQAAVPGKKIIPGKTNVYLFCIK